MQAQSKNTANSGLSKVDMAIFATYFCAAFAVTLPVDLLPVIAAEQSVLAGPEFVAASFVAAIASISTLCGGCGKLVNGFVCQGFGGRTSSSLYFIGMALSLLGLSFNVQSSHFGYLLGGLEFCASMQWTACTLILSNHFSSNPARFADSMVTLTLASTSGTLTAKAAGTALLHFLNDWRTVARVGSSVALVGSFIVRFLVSEKPADADVLSSPQLEKEENKLSFDAIKSSIMSVMGSPVFWFTGLAHATALMTRSADRVLGSFVLEAADLPKEYCGGLTAFMTIGFLVGLSNTKLFHSRPAAKSKVRFLGILYLGAVVSVLGLALCANANLVNAWIPSKKALAVIIALLAGSMTFNLSFQVYQIPAMASSTLFENNKAVSLSLFDAFGFFLASPVWEAVSKMTGAMGDNGWMAAWALLATLFAIGGTIMVNVMPIILRKQEESINDDDTTISSSDGEYSAVGFAPLMDGDDVDKTNYLLGAKEMETKVKHERINRTVDFIVNGINDLLSKKETSYARDENGNNSSCTETAPSTQEKNGDEMLCLLKMEDPNSTKLNYNTSEDMDLV